MGKEEEMSIELLLYLWGASWAFGSALAAVLRGEIGIVGYWRLDPPWWMLAIEVVIAALFSWGTVGFCATQNAYRASGAGGMSCAPKRAR